jgi:type I restriction enzyme S subunit
LDLAIRGRLSPQNREEESAFRLLERVKCEKELLNGTKAKKSNNIIVDERAIGPFELPPGWAWTRLGDALLKLTDGTHRSPPNFTSGDFRYVSAKNIRQGQLMMSNITYVSAEIHQEIYRRCNPEYGDILYIKDGATTGVLAINDLAEPFSMLSSVALLKVPTAMSNRFLFYVLSSPYFYNLMRDGMSGVAITRVTLTKLNAALVPVAPLAEQVRIVSKLKKLMVLCDELEARQQATDESLARLNNAALRPLNNAASLAPKELEQAVIRLSTNFDSLYDSVESVGKLQSAILQLAVQGTLTPRAGDDLATIANAREIEQNGEGMIGPKFLNGTAEASGKDFVPPFTIPRTWEWTTFDEIRVQAFTGLERAKPLQSLHGQFVYLKMNNITADGRCDMAAYTRVNASEDERCKYELKDGDFLFNTRNSYELVGKTCVFASETPGPVLFNNNILKVRFAEGVDPYFVNLWFISPSGRAALDTLKSSTTNVAAIYQGKLNSFKIPLPPIQEQRRIVEKVDRLMKYCDELVAKLRQADEDSENLMKAAARNVLELIGRSNRDSVNHYA